MKKAVVIQHHRYETLGGNFGSVLGELGYEIEMVRVFKGEPEFGKFDAPGLDGVDLIIALGGPMSANDGYAALRAEMEYLRAAADMGEAGFLGYAWGRSCWRGRLAGRWSRRGDTSSGCGSCGFLRKDTRIRRSRKL